MTLLEKLDMLKKTTGDTNASLARNSGIPYTTIDGLYKKGYSNMKLSTIQALCDYFGVSLDYLAKDEIDQHEQKELTLDGELSEREQEFIHTFRFLSAEKRHILLVIASALLQDEEASSDTQG